MSGKYMKCVDCGDSIFYGPKRCKKCFIEVQRKHMYGTIKKVIKLYALNKSARDIGRLLKVDGGTILRWLRIYKIKVKTNAEIQTGKYGKNSRSFKGLKYTTMSGYIKIYVPKYNKKVLEHRYKVEKFIGRKLKSSEIVHHIDGCPSNNKLSNLFLFADKGLHSSYERLLAMGAVGKLKSNLWKVNIERREHGIKSWGFCNTTW